MIAVNDNIVRRWRDAAVLILGIWLALAPTVLNYIEQNTLDLNATKRRLAWYVIPANHKWFRNLAVSQIVADTMHDLDMSFPKPTVDLDDIRRKYHAEVLLEKRRG